MTADPNNESQNSPPNLNCSTPLLAYKYPCSSFGNNNSGVVFLFYQKHKERKMSSNGKSAKREIKFTKLFINGEFVDSISGFL